MFYVAVARVEPSESLFTRNYIQLDLLTLTLKICSDENGEPVEEIELKGKLRRVDTQLVNKINPVFENIVVDGSKENQASPPSKLSAIELPADGYPIALIFNDGETFLMWAPTEM